jgi:hypothetical protein
MLLHPESNSRNTQLIRLAWALEYYVLLLWTCGLQMKPLLPSFFFGLSGRFSHQEKEHTDWQVWKGTSRSASFFGTLMKPSLPIRFIGRCDVCRRIAKACSE